MSRSGWSGSELESRKYPKTEGGYPPFSGVEEEQGIDPDHPAHPAQGNSGGNYEEEVPGALPPGHESPSKTPRPRRSFAMLLPLRVEQIPGLDDDDLSFETGRRLALLPPRLAEFTRAIFAGESRKEAAERLGYQTIPNPATESMRLALALLREEAKRRALLTAERAIARFREISDRAYDAAEWSEATGALREAARIAALYPEPSAGPAQGSPVTVTVALQLPQRETPPSFLVSAPARALPAQVEAPGRDPLLD